MRKGERLSFQEILDRHTMPIPECGCLIWTAGLDTGGYGAIGRKFEGTTLRAHRVSYELVKGSIPEGLELDHKCRVRSCVNPDHLEPVTRLVNVRRGLKGVLRTHCIHGHAYAEPGNLMLSRMKKDGARQCRACTKTPEAIAKQRAADQARYPRFKEQRRARIAARRENA